MRFFLFLLLLLLLASCKKKNDTTPQDESMIIVKVGESCLTENMLKAALPFSTSKKDALLYARDWLDLELLAQAAKKEGMDNDPVFRQKMYEIERNLLAMTYMNKQLELFSNEPSEEDLRNFFNNNSKKYRRVEKALDYSVLVFKKSATAWAVRKKINAATFFSKYALEMADSSYKSSSAESLSKFSGDLGEYLFDLKEGGIAVPRNVNGKVHLYLVRKKYPAGSLLSFNDVRDKVYREVKADLKKEAEIKLKEKLRKESNYIHNKEYFSDDPQSNSTKDTVKTKTGDTNA